MVAKSIGSSLHPAHEAVATRGNDHETRSTYVSSLVTKAAVAAFLTLFGALYFIGAAKIDPNAQLAGLGLELPSMAVPP
jgi:hypothetical protein